MLALISNMYALCILALLYLTLLLSKAWYLDLVTVCRPTHGGFQRLKGYRIQGPLFDHEYSISRGMAGAPCDMMDKRTFSFVDRCNSAAIGHVRAVIDIFNN